MPFAIEDKLVIAVSSSALFRLDEADRVFREQGLTAYREYQRAHQNEVLAPGVAFPFIRRLLRFNRLFPAIEPVEVVLLSHNDPDTGLRVFNSIAHYELGIIRAAFTTGQSPIRYIPAFNASLFLSANQEDVRSAIALNLPAGQVLESRLTDDDTDNELRIAFDFDGVIADDSAEAVHAADGLESFHASETANAGTPLGSGPLGGLFRRLGILRKLEDDLIADNPDYKRFLRTAIITARSAPAHARVVTTLRSWGNIQADDSFFLGGMDKGRIIAELKPHIFFDDQRYPHLSASSEYTPSVHVPFGVKNC